MTTLLAPGRRHRLASWLIRTVRRDAPGVGPADQSDEGRGRTALVTGASSGIGRSTATLLAAKGYDVVIVARRAERLTVLKDELEARFGVRVQALPMDLADPDAPRRIHETITSSGTSIDFLVNNAGYVLGADYAETSWEQQERFLRVTVLAPLELTHRFLPAMLRQGWGRVVNVSSIAARLTCTPECVLYSSGKTLLLKFTEGLQLENAGRGVNFTASMPGHTATEVFQASNWGMKLDDQLFPQLAIMSPDTVARQAYAAVMSGHPSLVHGWHHQLLGAVWHWAPPPVGRALSRYTAGVQAE
jgi:hypothetical protein